MAFIRHVPLFAILLIIYNVFIVYFAGQNPDGNILDYTPIRFKLPSDRIWGPSISDILVLAGLFVLYIEIVKATRTADSTIVEHTFSMFVFLVYLIEFLLVPTVGDSAFLILACMSFLDVVAGFTITFSTAKRDFSVGG